VAFARWTATDDEFQRRYGHLDRPVGVRLTAPLRRRLSPGLNVVGYFDSEMGVGEAGRLMVRAAERAGLPIATQVYRRTASRRQAEFALPDRTGTPFDVSVLCANADSTPRLAAHLDASRATDRHRIGLWFWEVAEFPRTMHAALDCVDEVWVASDFVRDAIQPHTGRPVTVFPLPIVTEPPHLPLARRPRHPRRLPVRVLLRPVQRGRAQEPGRGGRGLHDRISLAG
jgi:hypothetical protein